MDALSEFTFKRTYARYLEDECRREEWSESVSRYCNWLFNDNKIPEKVKTKCKDAILSHNVNGSMRALWAAGKPSSMDNSVIYNCSFVTLDDLSAFSESLFLLMCGVGVGFSCEKKYLDKLPEVKFQKNLPVFTHVVEDSREGWKTALDKGIRTWWSGRDISFDFSLLRPEGAPLKTLGGRSSGPDVLIQLLNYTRNLILGCQGRGIKPFEAHQILCETASVVIVGGTRRSALLSMSDLNDNEMRTCKTGEFHSRLFGANNSAVYYDRPNIAEFMDEWSALIRSQRGERGIANLYSVRKNAPRRRKAALIAGFNACTEISLRPNQFCNLSEIVLRAGDTYEDLREKATSAAWLGVLQAGKTFFPHLRPEWKINAEDERLIGVSLSGQMDNPSLLTPEILKSLKQHIVNVAKKASKIMGYNMPAATTCVKPAGTSSLVSGCSAGIHPRWSQYYFKNTMISVNDPLFAMMKDQGVPYFIPKSSNQKSAVIPFPVAAPEGAITRHDMSTRDQLEHYLKVATNYAEMSVSCTIYVENDQWLSTANWVYENWDNISGLSFFPKESDGHAFEWTPFEEIDKDTYEMAVENFPTIDYTKLGEYEKSDMGEGAKELACAGGACMI